MVLDVRLNWLYDVKKEKPHPINWSQYLADIIIANRRNWIELKNSTIYYTNDFDTALLSWQAIQQRNNALWISVFKILTVSFHNQNFHYKSDQWIWSQKLGYSISGINVKLKQNRFLAKNEFWTCINFIHFSCFSRKKFHWWERVIK